MTTLNRKAYERIIAEDLAWLDQQPRTLERDHIEQIIRGSVDIHYPPAQLPETGEHHPHDDSTCRHQVCAETRRMVAARQNQGQP